MRSKPRRGLKIVIVLALVLGVGGVLAYRYATARDETPTIRTAAIERGTVTSTISATGVLQALTTVDVKSNVGGQVITLAVDEGDRVTPGQLIAKIDPSDTLTSLEQQQADLTAARTRMAQSGQELQMIREQNQAQVRSAEQALEGARQRLALAEEQAASQPTLTSAAIKQAESNLRSAEAALKQVREAGGPQKLAAVQAEYEQAQASLDLAEKELIRQKELLAKGFAAKSAVDSAEQKQRVAKAQFASAQKRNATVKAEVAEDLNAAEARVEQMNAALDNARANSVQDRTRLKEVESARASVRQAEAALASARASLRQNQIRQGDITTAQTQVTRSAAAVKNAQTQLGYTTITAPRGGVVVKKYVDEGSIVSAGRSSAVGTGAGVSIIQIADTRRMFALVNVDETDIANIAIGGKTDITVDAYPDELFEGVVTKIAPQAIVEQNVTTIPVTVEIDMPDQRLKPGMNVNCEFIVAQKRNVLKVPNAAIKDTDRGSTVQVMQNGQPVARPVEVGMAGDDSTEITSGIEEGDIVVTAVETPKKNSAPPTSGMPGMGGGRGGRGMRGGPF